MTAPSIAHRALALSRQHPQQGYIGHYIDLAKASGEWHEEYGHAARHTPAKDHPFRGGSGKSTRGRSKSEKGGK